jgi:hypothetical protein
MEREERRVLAKSVITMTTIGNYTTKKLQQFANNGHQRAS